MLFREMSEGDPVLLYCSSFTGRVNAYSSPELDRNDVRYYIMPGCQAIWLTSFLFMVKVRLPEFYYTRREVWVDYLHVYPDDFINRRLASNLFFRHRDSLLWNSDGGDDDLRNRFKALQLRRRGIR
jgi:hypothetical protein